MRVAILGPVLVHGDDGPREVAGGRLQALLARLALDAGRPVSRGALAEALWNGDPPRDEGHALQSLVSRLRRALGDPGLVVQEAAGYRLAVAPEDVDVVRFERLVRDGAAALRAGDAAGAELLLGDALGLWRGPAGADAERLDELRLAACVDRLTAIAERGGLAEHVGELTELAVAHPLDERLAALRVRALAAAGRQADALAAYEAIRTALDDELGAMPSAELQAAHVAVLRGEVATAPRRVREGNLPAPRTSFVGREDDLERAGRLLARHRLVTLVGTGGAGKTRLALELAGRVPGTAWLVELASLGDGDALAPAMLGALGLRAAALPDRRAAAADAESQLVDALGARDRLVVLDNCEHIVAAVAALADRLLAACPGLRILATSREPLGIDGEALAPVGPLAEDAAVALFADRASSASPDFVLDDTTRPTVADICRRIDGLPLAIELAAARLRSLPLDGVAERLHDRFRLLTGGNRAAAGRQRTLRAVVDWSWDLLGEPERRLARRLAVFPAGATLAAAEEVCAGEGVDREDVFDGLCALVDRSLLQVSGGADARWRMLETIREYAEEEAERAGELQGVRERHARHFASVVAAADRELRGPGQVDALRRLRADRDNVLAALRYLADSGDAAAALRMAVQLLWFWALTDGRDEAVGWLRVARAAEGDGDLLDRLLADAMVGWADAEAAGRPPTEVMERALELVEGADLAGRPLLAVAAPILALFTGRKEQGDAMLDALEAHPDPWVRAMLPFARAQIADNDGRMEEVREHIAVALHRFREVGDRWGTAVALSELASLRMVDGDLDGAEAALAETMALMDELGSGTGGGFLLMRRAELRSRQGDFAAARDLLAEALDGAAGQDERLMFKVFLAAVEAELGDHDAARALRGQAVDEVRRLRAGRPDFGHQRAIVLGLAGRLEAEDGALEAARDLLAEAHESAVASTDMPIAGRLGEGVAVLALRLGHPEQAARILGAAMNLRGAEDRRGPGTAVILAELTEALGAEALEERLAAGLGLDRDAALAALDPAAISAQGEGDERDEQDRHPGERPREM
jgi:predicted ATPase/DNA-binding SARP family transcriptional activator